MIRLTFLFILFFKPFVFAQKIGFNYTIRNKEIVFKLVLKPHQRITIEYLNKYYGAEKMIFINKDSVDRTVSNKTFIDCQTMFHLGKIFIGKKITRYDYNITGVYGDSILIDCRYSPYKVYAERLSQGQLYTDIDSLVFQNFKEDTKAIEQQDCDSNYYLNLQNSVFRQLKIADDSIKIYTKYFTEFRKSLGYRQALQMHLYSKAFRELFQGISHLNKPDSCYLNTIRKFESRLNYLLSYPKLIISSKENYSALYGLIIYQIYKSQKDFSTENAFYIIDSLAKGDYNTICKLIFLNLEQDASNKEKWLKTMIEKNKNDTTLINYLIKLRGKVPLELFTMPLLYDRIFTNNLDMAFSLNEIIGNSDKKIYLLNFWASWCKPCIEEFKYLKILNKKFSNKQLSILNISIDDRTDNWKRAEKKYDLENNLSYKIKDSFKNKFLNQLGVRTIPRTVLINGDGRIIKLNAPNPNNPKLEAFIKNLIHMQENLQ